MKNIVFSICCTLCISLFSFSAHSEEIVFEEMNYKAYREYFPLEKKVEGAAMLVIFFSFASKESYDLIVNSEIMEDFLLRKDRYKDVVLIPVDFYSPYDDGLAERWFIDKEFQFYNGKKDISYLQFLKNLFSVMNEQNLNFYGDNGNEMVLMDILFASHAPDFLISMFYQMSRSKFFSIEPLVKRKIAEYNIYRKEMIRKFNVTSVPSVYVNGKYRINEGAMIGCQMEGCNITILIDHLVSK